MLPTSVKAPGAYKYEMQNQSNAPQTRTAVGWRDLVDTSVSNDGKKISAAGIVGYSWDRNHAIGTLDLTPNAYFEWTFDQSGSNLYVGLKEHAIINAIYPYNILYTYSNDIVVQEDGVNKWVSTGTDPDFLGQNIKNTKFRITRIGNDIFYQASQQRDGGLNFYTFYKSEKKASTQLFPYVNFGHATSSATGEYTSISDVVIQSQTILNTVQPGTGSYSKELTNWVYEAGVNWTASAELDPELSLAINSYINNLNGPYGYPSWKQIRTGETPVARYQKKNNIITFLKEELIFGADETPDSFQGLTKDTLLHFIEPPVTFRNKPLHTVLSMSGATDPLPIYHTYANNLTTFANPKINNFLGSIKCNEQMYDRIRSKVCISILLPIHL